MAAPAEKNEPLVSLTFFCVYTCVHVSFSYLLRGNQPEKSPVQVDLLLQLLGGEERPFTLPAARLHGGEGDVEDGALHVGVVLDVEDEHGLPPGGEHGRHALHEEAEERREEALLGHVLQAHRDAVGQHVVGDDGDTQRAGSYNVVDTVWNRKGANMLICH